MPSQEVESSDLFLKKEDFLLDTMWKGSHDEAVSENDVFMFDESAAPSAPADFPEKTVDLEPAAPESEYMFNNASKPSSSQGN